MVDVPQLAPLKTNENILCLSGLGRPFGVNRDKNGAIYITDMDLHTVFRLSPDLQTIAYFNRVSGWSFPRPLSEGMKAQATPKKPGMLNGPHSITFDQNNNMYVTTYYSPGILVFNQEAQYLHLIGGETSEFPLLGPASAFFNNKEELLVAEYALNAICVYARNGEFKGSWGWCTEKNAGSFGKQIHCMRSKRSGGFDRPHMAKEEKAGWLYCVDTWNHRLQRMNPEEGVLDCLGFTDKKEIKGWGNDEVYATNEAGGFRAPVAISFKSNGDFLVTDWGNHRLQIFEATGELKYVINDLDLCKPYDAQYLDPWIVVADSHHGRVLFVPQTYYE